MAKRDVPQKRSRTLKPRLYCAERLETTEAFNRGDRPLIHSTLLEDIKASGGWVSFIPPKSKGTIHLKLVEGASPHDAVREWFLVQEANKVEEPRLFDVGRLHPIWNYGIAPNIEKKDCGSFHLQATRGVSGYPVEAHRAWVASGEKGLYPPDLHALLAPDDYLPFMSPDPPGKIPAENRWVYIPIDMARPLEEQFKVAKRDCRKLQDYALALSGLARRRPKSSEARRDVLIYTLHYSSGLTVEEIAKRVFQKDQLDSAILKVKATIRRVNVTLRDAGFEPPKFTRQPKSPT